MDLRPATPADITPLAALARQTYAAAFGHTYELAADLAAHLDANVSEAAVAVWLAEDFVTLAVADGRIVGFTQFGPTPEWSYGGHPKPGDAALHRIYVAEGLRGSGLGGALLRQALEVMEAEAGDIYLDVWEGNLGGQRLYGRHGFVAIDRVKLKTASGASAGYDLVMVRRRA
jgi:ribosomal protein S18 acetylase RimI-like enzyme